jgi:hypothetical protein
MTTESQKKAQKKYKEKNREKINEKSRLWRAANPEKRRAIERKWEAANREKRHAQNIKHFGITKEDYSNLFVSQKTCCAICLRPSFKKRLAVDHDHKTGEVRGLLCDLCNRGLGMFGDSVLRLKLSILYLEKHQGNKHLL